MLKWLIVAYAVCVVLFASAVGYFVYIGLDAVFHDGLKATVDKIWCGPKGCSS